MKQLGIISGRTRYLNVRRDEMRVILVRNMTDPRSERFGKWEPISRMGFVVICPSQLEALNLLLYVGGRMFPCPEGLNLDDDQYERWLQKGDRMRIERYIATGKGEMLLSEFLRGWIPSEDEITQGKASHLVLTRSGGLRVPVEGWGPTTPTSSSWVARA